MNPVKTGRPVMTDEEVIAASAEVQDTLSRFASDTLEASGGSELAKLSGLSGRPHARAEKASVGDKGKKSK